MSTALKVVSDQPAFHYERAFSRNIGIFTEAEQLSLAARRVAIPGCGGVGGLHALTLARMGIGKFHIADFDQFEIENFNRQFGAKYSSLGEKKTVVIEREILDVNPLAEVTSFNDGVDKDCLDAFLQGVDVVVDSLDFFSFRMRERLFNRARDLGIPVVTAAPLGLSCALLVFTREGMSFTEYFDFKPDDSFRTLGLKFFFGLAPKPTHMAYMNPAKLNFSDGKGPSSVIGIDLCAAMAATEVMKLVLGRGPVASAPHYRQFDAFCGELKKGRLAFGNRHPLQKLKILYADRFVLPSPKGRKVGQESRDQDAAATSVATAREPSHDQIKAMVELGLTAPTGDNCQPWRLKWRDGALFIFHDDQRGRHAFNRANHASLFALGCFIEGISIAASKWGWQVDATLPKTRRPGPEPWATLRFAKGKGEPDPLCSLLPMRHTDRRAYLGGSVEHWIFAEIERELSRFEGIKLHWAKPRSPQLTAFIAKGETYLWQCQEAHRDLFKWLRFSTKEVEHTRDGMPWPTLGVNYPESRLLRLARSFRLQKGLNSIGFLRSMKERTAANLASSAALGLITVPGDDVGALVTAGRAMLRVWVQLNRAGYAVQPFATASLFVYDLLAGAMTEPMTDDFRALFASGREVLEEDFKLGEGEWPLWLFRTGVASTSPLGAKTVRLAVSDVLTFD